MKEELIKFIKEDINLGGDMAWSRSVEESSDKIDIVLFKNGNNIKMFIDKKIGTVSKRTLVTINENEINTISSILRKNSITDELLNNSSVKFSFIESNMLTVIPRSEVFKYSDSELPKDVLSEIKNKTVNASKLSILSFNNYGKSYDIVAKMDGFSIQLSGVVA